MFEIDEIFCKRRFSAVRYISGKKLYRKRTGANNALKIAATAVVILKKEPISDVLLTLTSCGGGGFS
ncbi:MAG: hypothetical protein LBF71_03685 [Campylobacteraceae bacterium]|nr:hypothetical protein [Campylobacteraceae bacterium]